MNTTALAVRGRPLQEDERLGEILAKSKFFADSRDAAQAVVKVLAGRELGFGPIASMTGVYFVKNKVTLSANLMAAAVQNSGTYRYRVLKHSDSECEIQFQERTSDGLGWEVIGLSTFSMEDAKKAGLASGDNWRKYPRNMLFARALSNGCKWYCPAAFAGQAPYTPDELDPKVKVLDDGEYVVPAAAPKVSEPSCEAPVTDAEIVELIPLAAGDSELETPLGMALRLMEETATTLATVKRRFHAAPEALSPEQLATLITALEQKKAAAPITVA